MKLKVIIIKTSLCPCGELLAYIACSVNLFTLRTLFGKVDTHFYLIDYELHVSDADIFFSSLSLSLSLPFAIKQIIKIT